MAKLIIVGERPGESSRREVELEGPVVTIGRARENDIVIGEPRSSRRHCRISRTDRGFLLEDLQSRNGTRLNGVPVSSKVLVVGDLFEIGSVRFYFEVAPAADEAAAPAAEGAAGEGRPVAGAPGPEISGEDIPAGPDVPEDDLLLSPEDLAAADDLGSGITEQATQREAVALPEEETVREEPGKGARPPEDLAGSVPILEEPEPEPEDESLLEPETLTASVEPIAFLEGLTDPHMGMRVPIRSLPFTIGRKADSDLRLADPMASGRHARIVSKGSNLEIEDLGSTNGTRVNGQRITRAILGPGMVVAIGKVRFRYEGPGVAAPPVASAEEVRSLEVSSLGEPEPFPVVGTVVLLVIILMLIGFGYQIASRVFRPQPLDPNTPSNRIGANFSFEIVAEDGSIPDWELERPEVAVARVDDERGVPPGRRCLSLGLSGPESTFAAMRYAHDLSVSPGRLYALQGSIESLGVLGAFLQVAWMETYGSDGRPLGVDTTEIVRGAGGFQEVQEVLQPLRGAVTARVSCVVFGKGGQALFDRIRFELVEKDPASPGGTVGPGPVVLRAGLEESGLAVKVSPNGLLSIERGRETLLHGLRLVFNPSTDKGLRGMTIGMTVDPLVQPRTGRARLIRAVPDLEGLGWHEVELLLAATEKEVAARYRIRKDGGGFPDVVGLVYGRGGLREAPRVLLRGSGELLPLEEVGGKRSSGMTWDPGERGMTIAYTSGDQPVEMDLSGPRDGSLYLQTIRSDALTRTEDKEACLLEIHALREAYEDSERIAAMFADADAAAARGELGAAIRILENVEKLYRWRTAEVAQAGKKAEEIRTKGRSLLQEIAAARDRLRSRYSPFILHSLRRRATVLAGDFQGTAIGTDAQALLGDLDAIEREMTVDPARAKKLLEQAKAYYTERRHGLSELYLRRVITGFPGSDEAREAKEVLGYIENWRATRRKGG